MHHEDGTDVRRRSASKLSQEVARAIVAAIRNGGYPPGARLGSERMLAREFDVSRSTIREALVVLQALGIAQVRRGSGVYVLTEPPPSGQSRPVVTEPLELTEARRMFEGESAALAAMMMTDDELDELARLIQVLARNRDREAGEEADRSFHIAIAIATRNAAIAQTVDCLWDARYASPACRKMFERMRDLGCHRDYEDHMAILGAIRARDPASARRAMHAHLSRIIDAILIATEAEALEQARLTVAMRRQELARRLSI